jgi:hypothetical protein
MTRRRVIFQDHETGDFYTTPEFNGDKEELEFICSNDYCEKDWSGILDEFKGILTKEDFRKASSRAQELYHSSLGRTYLAIEYFEHPLTDFMADEVYQCQNGEVNHVA